MLARQTEDWRSGLEETERLSPVGTTPARALGRGAFALGVPTSRVGDAVGQEVRMLWEAIPTALVAAFSPWTLLIVAGLLSRERPMRLALVFLGSAATVTLAIGFAVVEAVGATGADDSHRHRTVAPAIDVGVGVAVLVFAAVLARRPPKEAKTQERETRLVAAIVLGLVIGSPSPLYLASLHSIVKGNPDALDGTLYVLLIAALVLLMAEAPIVLYLLAPERTTAALDAANAWLARHGRAIAVGGAAAVGGYFLIKGLVDLL